LLKELHRYNVKPPSIFNIVTFLTATLCL
jgi:hypothetical protein